nr:RNA 2'-phosphotransferase [Phascolarctobacterium succinatutens]
MKVDVELREAVPPELLYHGTGVKYVASINRQGLIAKQRLYVHLSANVETAHNVGKRHGETFIYTVLAGEMARAGYKFYLSINGVWLTESVPRKFLRD